MEERPVDNPLRYGPIIHLLNQSENDMSKNTRDTQAVSTEKSRPFPKHLEHINLYAAGIDIGATSHFVAVPEGTSETTVREFQSTGSHKCFFNKK